MSIFQTMTTSFKVDLFNGAHDFSADTFKIALYDSDADIDESTTVYSTTDEVSGTGYSAGGGTLTVVAPTSGGTTAYVDFSDFTFSTVTLAARAALIYNSTNSNKSVCVLDFGRDVTKTAANLVIVFPAANALDAIVRIV